MAHLPHAEIEARHAAVKQDILSVWQEIQGPQWCVTQCPCQPDCFCMPAEEVPRIVMSNCLYVGELDRLFVQQPFLATHGFKVRWHCDTCESEMACGFPM